MMNSEKTSKPQAKEVVHSVVVDLNTQKTKSVTREVEFKQTAILRLDQHAVALLNYLTDLVEHDIQMELNVNPEHNSTMSTNVMLIIFKIKSIANNRENENKELITLETIFTRAEVMSMKALVELGMKYDEDARKVEVESNTNIAITHPFDADRYIQLKHLLLDLKLWLIGEVY